MITRRSVALALLLATGCGDVIPVVVDSSREGGTLMDPSDEMRDALDDAFGYWGREYYLTDERKGAVVLTIVDLNDDEVQRLHGRGERDNCKRKAWANYNPATIAHELGHLWGLGHVSYRAGHPNLMVTGHMPEIHWPVTDQQYFDAQAKIDRWLTWCAQ